jgi:hypothetical protein
MQFDVFISHSSHDKATADAACASLEKAGLRCWIAPRDILPGSDWGGAILEALDSCRAMVLIFSSNANDSPQIRREVERVVGRGVPVIPVRIEDTAPTKAMAYFMGPVHWLDAMTPPLEQHLTRLAESLKTLLPVAAAAPAAAEQSAQAGAEVSAIKPAADAAASSSTNTAVKSSANSAPALSRTRLIVLRCAVGVAAAIGAYLTFGTIWYSQFVGWLPTTAALTVVSIWLVYRNLNAQIQIAKVTALVCGLIWAYYAIWNGAVTNIPLTILEWTAAACLLYVALDLARLK